MKLYTGHFRSEAASQAKLSDDCNESMKTGYGSEPKISLWNCYLQVVAESTSKAFAVFTRVFNMFNPQRTPDLHDLKSQKGGGCGLEAIQGTSLKLRKPKKGECEGTQLGLERKKLGYGL